jgi:hypothetical protein
MGVGLNRCESRRGKITSQFPLASFEIMVPGNAPVTCPIGQDTAKGHVSVETLRVKRHRVPMGLL